MYRWFVMTALCLCLAGVAFAGELLVLAKEDAPPKTTTVARGPGYVSISYPASEGETSVTVGLIQVNYLDAGFLAELLGGTAIRVAPRQNQQSGGWNQQSYYNQNPYGGYPQQPPYGQPGTPQGQPPWQGGYLQGQQPVWPMGGAPVQQGYIPAPQSTLRPDAPLRAFVPEGIHDIFGMN